MLCITIVSLPQQSASCPASYAINPNRTCVVLNYVNCPTTEYPFIQSINVNGIDYTPFFQRTDGSTCSSLGYAADCIVTGDGTMPPDGSWKITFSKEFSRKQYTCSYNSNKILPILLSTFSVSRNKESVFLKWSTSYETNGQSFEIQRKTTNDFETISIVKAQNVETGSSYSYIDRNNLKGFSQYRLKINTLDGVPKYSEIKSVKGDGNSE